MTVWACVLARPRQLEGSVHLAPRAILDWPSVWKTAAHHVSALEDLENAHKHSIHGRRWERVVFIMHSYLFLSAGDVSQTRTEDKSRR